MSREIIARIDQEFHLGNDLVLATILKRIGSAPRSSGTRMIIRKDFTIAGTIGGGSLEARVLESAKEVMRTKIPQIRDFHFSGEDASAMEMICGGSVTILTEWLDPNDIQLSRMFDKLASLKTSAQNAWWIQTIHANSKVVHGCYLAGWDSVQGAEIDPQKVREVGQVSLLEAPQVSFFIEHLNQTGAVLIFGAGHVAQPVAHLCHLVDFRTVIFDDRPEFANPERFPHADEILVSSDFETAIQERVIDEKSSVVIITRGHLHDQVVLEKILHTCAGYIGMIGSKRKWKLLQEELESKGYSLEQIQRVHTPIGLDIGAETPAEIAISIVAELVQARAARQKSTNAANHS